MHVCDGQGGVVRCDQPARPCVHILKPIRNAASTGRTFREPAGHGLTNGNELRSVSEKTFRPQTSGSVVARAQEACEMVVTDQEAEEQRCRVARSYLCTYIMTIGPLTIQPP